MMILIVFGLIIGVLIYTVALPYCMNNRKIIYAKNKKYFNAPIAYVFTNLIIAGICIFVFGIVSFVMPQLNIANTKDSVFVIGCGLALFGVGILIGIIPIKKASADNHKGVVKDMIIASIGSVTALWMAFLPFISDYSQKKYEQYLKDEKQRENLSVAEQERIANSRIINRETDEKYSLNSDGTMFKNADGDWEKVSEAIKTEKYKLVK